MCTCLQICLTKAKDLSVDLHPGGIVVTDGYSCLVGSSLTSPNYNSSGSGDKRIDIYDSSYVNPEQDAQEQELLANEARYLHERLNPEDDEAAVLAPGGPAASASGKTKATASSFFSQKLGITDVATAVSGRSKCALCKQNIDRHSWRFEVQFALKRLPQWIHASCVKDLPRQLCSDSLVFLEGKLSSPLCASVCMDAKRALAEQQSG